MEGWGTQLAVALIHAPISVRGWLWATGDAVPFEAVSSIAVAHYVVGHTKTLFTENPLPTAGPHHGDIPGEKNDEHNDLAENRRVHGVPFDYPRQQFRYALRVREQGRAQLTDRNPRTLGTRGRGGI